PSGRRHARHTEIRTRDLVGVAILAVNIPPLARVLGPLIFFKSSYGSLTIPPIGPICRVFAQNLHEFAPSRVFSQQLGQPQAPVAGRPAARRARRPCWHSTKP